MDLSILLKEGNGSFRINQYILKESFNKIEVWERYYTKNRKIGEFDRIKYGNICITMFSHNTLTSVCFYTADDKDENYDEIFIIENKYPCEVGCKIEAQLEPLSFIKCNDYTLVPTQIDNIIRVFNYKILITERKYVKFENLFISFFYYFDPEEDIWKLTCYMDNTNPPEREEYILAE